MTFSGLNSVHLVLYFRVEMHRILTQEYHFLTTSIRNKRQTAINLQRSTFDDSCEKSKLVQWTQVLFYEGVLVWIHVFLGELITNKAPRRSNPVSRVINYYSGLSFLKPLWSVVTFSMLFKDLEAKSTKSTKEILLRGDDKHISYFHLLFVESATKESPHQRN